MKYCDSSTNNEKTPSLSIGWSNWMSLAGNMSSSHSTVTVNDDGSLEVFAKLNNNQLYHICKQSQFGNWSRWEPLFGSLGGDGVAVAKNYYRGLEVFVRGTDNALYHKWQDKQHGNWSSWESLGGILSKVSVFMSLFVHYIT